MSARYTEKKTLHVLRAEEILQINALQMLVSQYQKIFEELPWLQWNWVSSFITGADLSEKLALSRNKLCKRDVDVKTQYWNKLDICTPWRIHICSRCCSITFLLARTTNIKRCSKSLHISFHIFYIRNTLNWVILLEFQSLTLNNMYGYTK